MPNSSKFMIAAACALTMALEVNAATNPFLMAKMQAMSAPRAALAAATVKSAVKEAPVAVSAPAPQAAARIQRTVTEAPQAKKEKPEVAAPAAKSAINTQLAAALAKTTAKKNAVTVPAVSKPASKPAAAKPTAKAEVSKPAPTASVSASAKEGRFSRIDQSRRRRMIA